MDGQGGHEGIGIELFHVEDPLAAPLSGQHHLGADHGWYAGGVGNGLRADLLVALGMIADIVDQEVLFPAVLDSLSQAADAGAAGGEGTERGGIRQDGFQELQRDDLAALIKDGVDPRHANILENLEVIEIIIRKGHPETSPFEAGDVADDRFQFLMKHQVNFHRPDPFREIERLANGERIGLHPLAVLVEPAAGGHFADIDLGIEIGGKGLVVLAGVGVDDVEIIETIKMVFEGVGGEDVGHARIEPGTEQSHESLLPEAVMVGPLPFVLEAGRLAGFVIGGVEVMDAGFQAGFHEGQVLIGEGQIEEQVRFDPVEQGDGFGYVIRIDRGRGDAPFGALFDRLGNGQALRDGAAGEGDFRKDFGDLGALVRDDTADAAGAYDENSGHGYVVGMVLKGRKISVRNRYSHACRSRRRPGWRGARWE